MSKLLFTGKEWDFEKLEKTWAVIKDIAINKYGLSFYDTDFEVITARQMIQNYTTNGLPVYYCSWEQGKHFNQQWREYLKGDLGLAYEIVINTDPCICYLMDSNDMALQTLVMAHAACLDKDTEYFTEHGWKKISEYNGEKIAQYHENGKISFVQPSRYVVNEEKEFYALEARGISQRVTKDHKMVWQNGNGNIIFQTADEFVKRHNSKTRGHNGKFITVFTQEREEGYQVSKADTRLRVAIKADASRQGNKYRFHLKKTRKIQRLEELLNSLGIVYDKKPSYGGRYSIRFHYNFVPKEFTWEEFNSYTADEIKTISEEVLLWDGHHKGQTFSTHIKQSADVIQAIWASLGYGTSIYGHAKKGYELCYKVTRSLYSTRSISRSRGGRPNDITIVEAVDGKSYCFTVPTGMFLARRDDCIFVTGNCGHNSMFKNNYLFKDNTEANYIIEYMGFADKFIKKCERLYGEIEVMKTIDVAHMLQDHSFQPKRNKPPKIDIKEQRKEWTQWLDAQKDEMDKITFKHRNLSDEVERFLKKSATQKIKVPEYDILYFIEKNIDIAPWQKEIMRIVRIVSSYFYPQVLCKLLHEAWASYVHYTLCTDLWEQGYIDAETYLSIKHYHTQVAKERPGYKNTLNPYYLGFNMFKDIERMCKHPTDEDRKYFPNIAGQGDKYFDICKEIAYNNRDESFIRQYLSPALIREMKLVVLEDDSGSYDYKCVGSHEPEHYRQTVNHIADQYQLINGIPQLVITQASVNHWATLKYLPYKDRGVVQDDKAYIMLRLEALTKWKWEWGGQDI